MPITLSKFGVTTARDQVTRYTLSNDSNVTVDVINFGANITSIKVPDKNGTFQDIVLGFDTVKEYEADTVCMGGVVGRYANRISKGQFTLPESGSYQLAINNAENHIHGGIVGFNKRIWQAEVIGESVYLSYMSDDGEEGYPGELNVYVCYSLSDQNELRIDYRARTTKTTPINLTNHAYFNLAGHNSGHIYDHMIRINADTFTPKYDDGIPTGDIASVCGSMFDLRQSTRIGDRIRQIPADIGYDHNFCVNGEQNKQFVARVSEIVTGRNMDMFSTQPGVQFYTANFLNGLPGKDGAVYEQHHAFCLESQNYPNAVNQPNFPNALLKAGDTYEESTWYRFSTD